MKEAIINFISRYLLTVKRIVYSFILCICCSVAVGQVVTYVFPNSPIRFKAFYMKGSDTIPIDSVKILIASYDEYTILTNINGTTRDFPWKDIQQNIYFTKQGFDTAKAVINWTVKPPGVINKTNNSFSFIQKPDNSWELIEIMEPVKKGVRMVPYTEK